jgi:hypothetical protein
VITEDRPATRVPYFRGITTRGRPHVTTDELLTKDRPAKGTLRLRWANGDAGRVNLPSVAGVPLGRRRYVWLGPKVCLILTRIKGGWSTAWRPPSPGGAS